MMSLLIQQTHSLILIGDIGLFIILLLGDMPLFPMANIFLLQEILLGLPCTWGITVCLTEMRKRAGGS